MSQQKKLQMMTFIPKNTTINVFTLGFPTKWKEKLVELTLAVNPSFNYELYILPLCSLLGKLCSNWIYGLIEISNLRKNSDDSKWIVCLTKIDKNMCEQICLNLKAAAISYYDNKIGVDGVQKALNEFLDILNPDELFQYVGEDEIEIIDNNGKIASSYAYNGLCLKLMSNLVGKTIELDSEKLILYYSAKNELMSQVLSASNGDLYAYVFSFSLQTIPVDNYPMILLNCSRRRFKNTTERSQRFLTNKMGVYVKYKDESRYFRLNIGYSSKKKALDWDQADKKCYEFIHLNGLPEAGDVMNTLKKFNGVQNEPRILCVVSPENSFKSETTIGVGVGVKDEEQIYNQIYELISDSVEKSPMTAKAISRRDKLNPDDKLTDILSCLSKTGYKGAVIEIFSDSDNSSLAEEIKKHLDELLFHSNNENVDFYINTELRVLGDYSLPLSKEEYAKESERITRIRLISDKIGRLPEGVMGGSIIILPKNKSKEKDAKDLLRCGFAMVNRVTQFINPEQEGDGEQNGEDTNIHKIKNTIYDLLRQFGYSKRPKTWSKVLQYPVFAIDAPTNLYSMSGKKVRALPMMLKFNAEDRLITVESPVFNNGLAVPYYKACLELCKLSMTRDCDKICNDALRRYAEQKIKGLENLYRDRDAILIVSGDGFVRNELWPGISNKKISTYSFSKMYCPDYIDVGNKNMSVSLSLNNSKLRIVRIRANDEVPNYYLYDDEKVSGNADAIYSFHDVYYATTTEMSVDKTYRLGNKESSISNPKHSYREKKLVEYFPLSICQTDDPISIINYLNELRGLSPQFNKVTNFPAPLHYLSKIKEYFDFK